MTRKHPVIFVAMNLISIAIISLHRSWSAPPAALQEKAGAILAETGIAVPGDFKALVPAVSAHAAQNAEILCGKEDPKLPEELREKDMYGERTLKAKNDSTRKLFSWTELTEPDAKGETLLHAVIIRHPGPWRDLLFVLFAGAIANGYCPEIRGFLEKELAEIPSTDIIPKPIKLPKLKENDKKAQLQKVLDAVCQWVSAEEPPDLRLPLEIY